MTPIRRLLTAAFAALVAVAATPAAASADRWPPVTPLPPDPHCVPAEFSDYDVTVVGASIAYTMEGTVRSCTKFVPPGAFWTVATFRGDGTGTAFGPRSYLSHVSTEVTFTFDGADRLDSWAACVVKNLRPDAAQPQLMRADPVACVGPGEVDGVPAAVRVPTDDPRFAGVLLEWLRFSDRPFCGSCL